MSQAEARSDARDHLPIEGSQSDDGDADGSAEIDARLDQESLTDIAVPRPNSHCRQPATARSI